ncbi:MAG: hypothetical protein AB8U25_03565 [Rickettsiales endosymbiont of Dermacentor nuttalli]
MLWEPNNHWKSTLNKYLPSDYRENFIIPTGDLDDISLVNFDIIKNADLIKLQTILDKYNTQNALIAIARYFIDIKTSVPALELTLKYLKASEEFSKIILINDNNNNSLQFLLQQAVTEVINVINITTDDILNRKTTNILFNVDIHHTGDWINIRRKLMHINKINNLVVKEMSIDNAIISIDYFGSKEELFTELKSYGFIIDEQYNVITVSL